MNQINAKDLRAIRAEDVPEAYQDIVEALGLEVFLTLTDLCGGLNLYIPSSTSKKSGISVAPDTFKRCSAMARWPELEIGRNSAIPWTRPRRIEDRRDNQLTLLNAHMEDSIS